MAAAGQRSNVGAVASAAAAGTIDIDLLRRNRLFGILDPGEMQSVLEVARLDKVEAGRPIFAKGDPGDSLFAILRGKVQVTTDSADGKTMLLNILSDGDVFGEIAMLDGGERTAGVTALEPCRLLRLDRRDFLPLLESRPGLSIRLMGVLCERLRWTSGIIEDTVFLPVTRRLAKRLLHLAQTHGRHTEEGVRISTFVSQEGLANMLGVSREFVNKTLKTFIAAGAIGYSPNGYLLVRDLAFLEAQAG